MTRLGALRRFAPVSAALMLAGTLVACSTEEEQIPSIGYAIDNTLSTYNAGTTEGSFSGAVQAFSRVLPGFSLTAPSGGAVADTDIGTAVEVPGQQRVITYTLAPQAVWSDGVPITCDDIVLAWAARSDRFVDPQGAPVFDPASTAGYADIERVDCAPGEKAATVVFRADRPYVEWRALFGATTMLPAHVAARTAGVPDITSAVADAEPETMARIGDAWNTAWTLTPGAVDPATFPSAGPLRIESFSAEDGLVLVPNERWWGVPAATDRIVVWPKGVDIAARAASGDIEVIETGAPVAALDGFTSTADPGFGVEQLVLATAGVFENPAARRAFAACVPRAALFDEYGHPGFDADTGRGSGVVDSRTTLPSTLPYRAVAATAAERNRTPDVAAVTSGLEEAGLADPVVRIGYLAPDDRRRGIVDAIAESCGPLGIEVVDASSPTFVPTALREGTVDAVLTGTAGVAGASGSASPEPGRFALRTGQGINLGGYSNPQIDGIVDRLAVDDSDATVLSAAVEAEGVLWTDVPTLPLYNAPRITVVDDGMQSVQPNPTVAGAGWNMDTWTFVR